jgi:hypothetical protein
MKQSSSRKSSASSIPQASEFILVCFIEGVSFHIALSRRFRKHNWKMPKKERLLIPVQYSYQLRLVPEEELDQLSLMLLRRQTLLCQNPSSQEGKHVVASL